MRNADELREGWTSAFNRADVVALAAMYSADVRYYTPAGQVDEGRDAIIQARQAERDAVAAWRRGASFRSNIVPYGHDFAVVREVDGAWAIEHHMATSSSVGHASNGGRAAYAG